MRLCEEEEGEEGEEEVEQEEDQQLVTEQTVTGRFHRRKTQLKMNMERGKMENGK